MSDIIRAAIQARNIPRPPYPDEEQWFATKGADIPAYAADDNAVVFNPSHPIPKTREGYESLWANEGARIEMRNHGDFFTFPVEPHQQKFFETHSPDAYAKDPQAARQTIAARILAGDRSLAPYTPKQEAAALRVGGRAAYPMTGEEQFQNWYRGWAAKTGIDPNPDAPEHHYDYRAAHKAGATPAVDPQDGFYHWPSQFKRSTHPNRFVDGVDTITGELVK